MRRKTRTRAAVFIAVLSMALVPATTAAADNIPPTANSQVVQTLEDTPRALTLSGSDSDGDPLTYTIVSQPGNGTLTGTAPALTYRPDANFNGTDTFTFRVSDGRGGTAQAVAELTVAAVNDPPVAPDLAVTTNEDAAKPINLGATDVDGDALTYSVVVPPANGTLTGTAPALTYLPSADFNGADGFMFVVDDGTSVVSATVGIDVVPVNDAPRAFHGAATTPEDTATSLTIAGTDIDGDAITYRILTPPARGSLIGVAPHLTYTPTTNVAGDDSFTFEVDDGPLTSTAATISIAVGPVNDQPVAIDTAVSIDEDVATTIAVGGSDVNGDVLTFEVLVQPAHGVLSGAGPAFQYTPAPDFFGADSFTYRVDDGQSTSEPATVTIDVSPVNDPPVASDRSVSVAEDGLLAVNLLATDVDGDPLTYAIDVAPLHGTLAGTAPTLTYAPAADYNGADSFTFAVQDGVGGGATTRFDVTVTPVNDLNPNALRMLSGPGHAGLYGWGAATMLDGSVLIGDYWNYRIQHYAKNGTLLGTFVNNVGFGATQHQSPYGIAVDPRNGDVYFADTDRYNVDKYDAAGNFLLTFGTQGDGVGKFLYPSRVAVASDGRVFVADSWANMITVHQPDGTEIDTFGTFGSLDGQLKQPHGIAFDQYDRLWVADTMNHRVQVFDADGNFLFKFGSKGIAVGLFKGDLRGVAVDKVNSWAYVVDAEGNRIHKFDLTGAFITRFGTAGSGLGQFSDGGREVAVDGDGNVWVGDMPQFRAQKFSPTGVPLLAVPTPAQPPPLGLVNGPRGVAVDALGKVFVTDTYNQRILKLTANGEFVHQWGSRGRDEYAFNYPRMIAVDRRNGDVVVADTDNHRIKKYDNNGVFKWEIGGRGAQNGKFKNPHGVDVRVSDGTIFVADTGNDRVVVLDEFGTFVRTIGRAGTSNGQFQYPRGIGADPDGSLWVTDSTRRNVQHFTDTGEFLGKFGTKGTADDQLDGPFDVAIGDNWVFVADSPANKIKVWTRNGTFVRTIGASGGKLQNFRQPQGLDLTPDGQLFVAEQKNERFAVWQVFN